jgi:hypothetical protein
MELSDGDYTRVQAAIAAKGFARQDLGFMLRAVTKSHTERIMAIEYADFGGAAFAKRRLFDAAAYLAEYAALNCCGLDTGRTQIGFEQKLSGKLYDDYAPDFVKAVSRITSDILRSVERNLGGKEHGKYDARTDTRERLAGTDSRDG